MCFGKDQLLLAGSDPKIRSGRFCVENAPKNDMTAIFYIFPIFGPKIPILRPKMGKIVKKKLHTLKVQMYFQCM